MPSDHDIGKAQIRLEVDASRVKQQLDEAKAEVTQSTEKIERDVKDKVGGGFEEAGKKIEDSTRGVRKFSGAISSTVGTLTSLLGAATAIFGVVKLLERATDNIQGQAERIGHLLPGVEAAIQAGEQQLDNGRQATLAEIALKEKIAKLDEAKAETERRGLLIATNRSKELAFQAGLDLSGYTLKSRQLQLIDEERRQTVAQLGSLRERLRSEYESNQLAEKRAAIASAIKDQMDAIAESMMGQEEQIQGAYRRMYEQLSGVRDDIAESDYQRYLGIIAAKRDAELKAIRDAADAQAKADQERTQREEDARRERERKERESAEKMARAQADAIAKAVGSALDQIGSKVDALNDNTSHTLDALLRHVEVAVSNMGVGS